MPQEREWLSGVLAAEQERREKNGCTGRSSSLRDGYQGTGSGTSGGIYCGLTIGLYGTGFWMPQIIRSLNPAFSNTEIGVAMMVPFLVALVCDDRVERPFRSHGRTALAPRHPADSCRPCACRCRYRGGPGRRVHTPHYRYCRDLQQSSGRSGPGPRSSSPGQRLLSGSRSSTPSVMSGGSSDQRLSGSSSRSPGDLGTGFVVIGACLAFAASLRHWSGNPVRDTIR